MTWPELAFPTGMVFAQVNEYAYSVVPFTRYVVKVILGNKVIVKVTGFGQHWEDASFRRSSGS